MDRVQNSAAQADGGEGLLQAPPNRQPIAVDIDGTLLRTDLLYESFILLIQEKPWALLLLPLWLLRGKAYLKRRIALLVMPDVDTLPVNETLLGWLREKRRDGASLGLFSASDQILVQRVAARFGLFSVALGSDGRVNLSGPAKLSAIRDCYGPSFTYVGDGHQDVPIWTGCGSAILVGRKVASLRRRLPTSVAVGPAFSLPGPRLRTWGEALRVHQWVKNSLVFLPLLLSGMMPGPDLALLLGAGFLAFCLLSSATYLLNDLFDLPADRRHHAKRYRPLASGALPIGQALLAVPVLAVAVAGLLLPAPPAFIATALTYLALTLAYSFRLKRHPILDVILLGALFTLRIAAGITLLDQPLSPWLLTFSMFFFTSLALMKRYSECRSLDRAGGGSVPGRGYQSTDMPVLLGMGLASAFCAPLIFFSYLVDPTSPMHAYSYPEPLWVICVLIAYWLGRAWLLACRGQMNEDPVLFALKDRASLLIASVIVLLMLVTAHGRSIGAWFPL